LPTDEDSGLNTKEKLDPTTEHSSLAGGSHKESWALLLAGEEKVQFRDKKGTLKNLKVQLNFIRICRHSNYNQGRRKKSWNE